MTRSTVLLVLGALMCAQVEAKAGDLPKYLRHHEPLSFDVRELHRRHAVSSASSTDRHFDFSFTALNKTFSMRLQQDTVILSPDFQVHVRESDTKSRTVHFDRRSVVSGTLRGAETLSSATFVMTKTGMIGSIHDRSEQETYFIEDAHRWYADPPFDHVIYRQSDLTMDMGKALERAFEGDAFSRMLAVQGEMNASTPVRASTRSRRYDKSLHNTCELAMVADYLFFANTGQGSVATTTNLIISWVASMTRIYKFSSFTGVGLGIQFALRQVTVYTTTTNIYATSSSDVNVFLDIASLGDPLIGDWNSVCLAHVLTHRTFDNGILGLAWVGSSNAGICAKAAQFSGGKKSLNSGVSTSQNFGQDVPAIVSIITMAHECGHNFGSTHDQPGSSSAGQVCAPGGSTGNYIMFATASSGLQPNNDQFSQCSMDLMGALILNRGAVCFTNRGQSAICGNGIFEGVPEQCDCGVSPSSPNATQRCAAVDPCCLPNCSLVGGAQCSPRSGACCHGNCTLRGFPPQPSGIYPDPANTSVVGELQCAGEDLCRKPRYCIADPLFLGACPPEDWISDPTRPTLNVTFNSSIPTCSTADPPCYLFHQPTGTPCTGALCSVTGCDLSLCQLYLTTNVSGQVPPVNFTRRPAQPCLIATSNLFDDIECQVSCEFQPGVCVSTFQYVSTPDGMAQNITATRRAPGTFCSNFRGRCDTNGRCVKIQIDDAIDAINNLNLGSWVTDNWYIVLAAGGGAILLGVALKLTYQRKKIPIQNALRRLGQTLRRASRRGGAQAAGRNPALAAAARPDAKARHEQRISRENGFRRLQRFFPTITDQEVIWREMRAHKSEEDVVRGLLKKGHPLAAIEPNTL